MTLKLKLILIFIFMFGFGCASQPHNEFAKVQVGMEKRQVLYRMGNPKITRRYQGQDEWIYRFYQDDKPKTAEVIFQNGFVVDITQPMDSSKYRALLESDQLERQLKR